MKMDQLIEKVLLCRRNLVVLVDRPNSPHNKEVVSSKVQFVNVRVFVAVIINKTFIPKRQSWRRLWENEIRLVIRSEESFVYLAPFFHPL